MPRCVANVNELFEVIHEDADLLVVNKPPGLVCHPTKGDERSSLIGRVRLYLGTADGRLVNRLDRETSGLVLIAKSNPVAGELGKLVECAAVQKKYHAIVHGWMTTEECVIDAPLGQDESSLVAIKDCVRPDGAAAQTHVRVERRLVRDGREFSFLSVFPVTGRKHQIRIHLAHAGCPILGDKIYGGDESIYLRFVEGRMTEADRVRMIVSHHALHAAELRFFWRGQERSFVASASEEFLSFLNCARTAA